MAGDAVGTVNICLAASLASVVAPALLMRVAEYALALVLDRAPRFPCGAGPAHAVALGEADLALLPSVSDVDGLQSQPIYTERLQLLGVPELLESLPDPVPVRMLERVSLALPSRGHDLRRYLDGLAAGAGVSLRTRFTVDGPDITRSLVEAGLCCAVLPRSMVGVHDSRIAARRLVRPVPGRTLSIAWLADRPMTRAIRLVRQNLVETMRALVASGGLDGRLVADRFVSHDLDTD
ncbi:MAG: LysR substrate-binding domain-containing protein [Burkholderiaceae bacterium]